MREIIANKIADDLVFSEIDSDFEKAFFDLLIRWNVNVVWNRDFPYELKRQLLLFLLKEKIDTSYYPVEGLKFYYANSIIDKLYDFSRKDDEKKIEYRKLVAGVQYQVSMIFCYAEEKTMLTGQWSEPITPGWMSADVTFGIRL